MTMKVLRPETKDLTPATLQGGQTETRPALLDYGFRLFFLGAAVWTLVDMILWMTFYTFHQDVFFPRTFSSPMSWHAHEMIYGYGMAVVAGFLLTAVVNWTGRTTLTGYPLALLFLTWMLARVLPLQGTLPAFIAARCFDLVFLLALAVVTVRPCLQSDQKLNSLLIAVQLSLMTAGSILYALGVTSLVPGAARIGLYLGLYVLVLLTVVMGRRVIPSFIESASAKRLQVRNFRWVDRIAAPLVALYAACELLGPIRSAAPIVALLLVIILGVRLAGWYTHFLWRRPLFWVLYVGYGWLLTGFALRAASAWRPLNPFLLVHAFGAGGIGMMTLGMMARVALGHSGRQVGQPPRCVGIMFVLIAASSAFRVFMPLAVPAHVGLWVAASQFIWIGAFLLFVIVYAPILTTQVMRHP